MTAYQPIAFPADQDEARAARQSWLFAHASFITCMILQRFGLMAGDSALFLSLPVFGLLLGWSLVAGIGTVRERGAALYLVFAGWAMTATLGGLLWPDARFGFSFASL